MNYEAVTQEGWRKFEWGGVVLLMVPGRPQINR